MKRLLVVVVVVAVAALLAGMASAQTSDGLVCCVMTDGAGSECVCPAGFECDEAKVSAGVFCTEEKCLNNCKMAGWMIAAVAIAVGVFILLSVVLVCCCCKKSERKRGRRH